MDKQILDEYKKIFLESYKQNYTGMYLHPEAGPESDSELNYKLNDIYMDLIKIDDVLISTGYAINNLLIGTTSRLEEVKKCIMSEKERCQDIQMLCNKYTDFDNVNSLDLNNFTGSYSYENGNIFSPVKKNRKIDLEIISIDGNGYEGNQYVYNNFEYQKNIYDTSIRKNIIDNKISTYYEYSRITIQNDLEETNTYFNKDNTKARCTITLKASDLINYLDINTEDLGIFITSIEHSIDGIKYYDINLKSKISINNKLDSYQNYGYVYGSGVIEVPLCNYVRITFETDRDKTDTIAYEKTLFNDSTYYEYEVNQFGDLIDTKAVRIPTTSTTTYVVKGAKRSAIKLNNITAYRKAYNEKMQIATDELISTDAYSISLFANVYVPEDLGDDAVIFTLVINGMNFKVVPINSNLNGTKVIRFSGGKSNKKYTELIGEKIKSARLVITFNNKSTSTPFINNIKVLIGGEL